MLVIHLIFYYPVHFAVLRHSLAKVHPPGDYLLVCAPGQWHQMCYRLAAPISETSH